MGSNYYCLCSPVVEVCYQGVMLPLVVAIPVALNLGVERVKEKYTLAVVFGVDGHH